MEDICFVYTHSNTQGRLGTHAFDLVYPPLGIGYLSAVLEQEGYSVRILDASALRLSTSETLDRLRNQFRIVGFYCHTQNYPLICEMATELKASDAPPTILIGGPHATAVSREALDGCLDIDALAFGEAERTIVEMMPRLLDGRSLEGVAGTWYREGDAVRQNPPRAHIEDLDTIPPPAWHLYPMDRYQSFVESDGHRALHIIGSRGCFSDCNYCFSTKMWGPKVRWHSPARVLEEMEHLSEHYGVRFFQFFDDNFTYEPRRLRALMPAFRERGWKNRWVCSTRIDLLTEETCVLLKEGGIHHLAIGIETINDRLLQGINKGVTRKQTEEVMARCQRLGIRVMGMFIIGLPTETREETLETLEFARNTRLYLAIFSHLTVYPGTNFWTLLKDSPHLERDYSRYALSRRFTYIEPPRTREELDGLIAQAYRDFYLKPRTLFTLTWMMLRNPRKWFQVAWGFLAALRSLLFPGVSAVAASDGASTLREERG